MSFFQNKKDSAKKLANKLGNISRTDDILSQLIDKAIDGELLGEVKVADPTENWSSNISDFAKKRKKKRENHTDVFKKLLDVVNSFLDDKRPVTVTADPNATFFDGALLKQLAIASLNKTLNETKQILIDSVIQVLFIGDGICGTDKTFEMLNFDSVNIKPEELDFLKILQVDPGTSTGKVVYEKPGGDKGLKMNRLMYDTIIDGTTQTITTKDGVDLFDMNFNQGDQQFEITGLSAHAGLYKLEDFMTGYYSTIEYPDINHVINTAVQATIHGDGEQPAGFDISTNLLNRLLSKLCGYCGNSEDAKKGLGQSPAMQFNENDQDIEFFFDFDDVEGIDLDDEKDRLNKVLRFRDCQNFTVPINKTHFEDFIYLNGDINKKLDDVLLNTAIDAQNLSGGSLGVQNFHINLINMFILNLPKALVQTVLSPKYFLPIVILYKAVTSNLGVVVEDAKILMKKLWKLFYTIINKILWRFRDNFWKLAKPHLIRFLAKFAKRILLNKRKRWLLIIAALIAILLKLLSYDLSSCKGMFEAINFAIDAMLIGAAIGVGFVFPGFLLSFSNLLGGKSPDVLKADTFERMSNSGINTGNLFDQPSTKFQSMISNFIDAQMNHEDLFGYVATGNEFTVLMGPNGPIPVLPGQIKSNGKGF